MHTPTQDQLPTIIHIGLAAKIAERSPETIRRWVRAGILADKRTAGDTRSRLLIDRQQLLAHLSGTTPSVEPAIKVEHTPDHNVRDRLIEHLEADKARLQVDLDRVRGELRGVRVELHDCRQVKTSLESQVNGGVRGLLRGAVKRWGR